MRKIMTLNEVPKPIINSPKEPVCHWRIEKGEPSGIGYKGEASQQDCENQSGDEI